MGERPFSRRELLKAAGTAASGFVLAGCTEEDPYALEKPEVPGSASWTGNQEKIVATACGQCPAGCGVRVRVVEGRAVKIEGNPDCPLSQGGLGPKGQAGLHVLYHPDRVPGPLKRVGPRGSGRWTQLTWDEAIREVGESLKTLRAQGKARSLVVVDGEPRGLMHELWGRFLEAYGSPNHLSHRSTTDAGATLGMLYMQGVAEVPAYDWPRTRYVLGFGTSLFESWCQTIHVTRASSQMRRGLPGRRVKFVQVATRFSATAAKADEWVPIEPATYGALALGLAHVLIKKELYDKDFVRDHCFGFEGWVDGQGRSQRGFRDLALVDYPPEKVAEITGIPAAKIEQLAREMTDHRPAVALTDGAAASSTNGLGTAMAIHALNALLGNLERPGGVLVERPAPLEPWKPVTLDEVARKNRAAPRIDGVRGPLCPLGEDRVQGLPDAVLSGKPYPVEALVLYRSNPVFSKPEGRRWREALGRIPLVISCSPLRDESTLWADFVLPDSTYLERWEPVIPAPSAGRPIINFRQPVVEPLHDTLPTGDVVLRLARTIGSPVEDALPWEDVRAAWTERLKGIHAAKTGSIVKSSLSKFRKALQRAGGWWTPGETFEDWDVAFRTPSGKFEFYSQAAAARLGEVFPDAQDLKDHLQAAGVTTNAADLCLPHWEPPRFSGRAEEFPFVLLAYRGIDYAEGGLRHLPRLRELPAAGRGAWHERIELNPRDAARMAVRDREWVWVESVAGRKRLMVRILPGTRPGTIGLPLGHGVWPPAPDDEQQAGGYVLLANVSDPLAGILALQGTRVRVRKVGEV